MVRELFLCKDAVSLRVAKVMRKVPDQGLGAEPLAGSVLQRLSHSAIIPAS